MSKSIREITKKRGRPATTGKGEPIMVRMHDPELAALDKWIAKQKDGRTRPDAIRLAVREWLTGKGLLKAAASIHVEASNDK